MPANRIGRRRAFRAAIRCAASRSPEASPATMATRADRSTLADDAAFGFGEEIQDLAHRRAIPGLARELAGIGEDGVAADLAVMREMHVRHDPVVAADAGHSGVERGAAVDGDVFADHVAVADLDRSVLVGVFLVLRRRADRGEMEDAVAPADAGTAVQHDMRADPGAFAQLDPGTDD